MLQSASKWNIFIRTFYFITFSATHWVVVSNYRVLFATLCVANSMLWHPLHYFKRKLSYWYLIPSPYPHFLDGVPVQLWERGWLWWNQFIISYLHIINGPSIWYTHTYPRSGQLLKLTPIPFLCDLLVLFYISLFWTFPVALHRNYNYQLLNSFLLSTTSWCVAALVVIVKMWWPYLVSSRAGNEALQRLRLYNHGEGPF